MEVGDFLVFFVEEGYDEIVFVFEFENDFVEYVFVSCKELCFSEVVKFMIVYLIVFVLDIY